MSLTAKQKYDLNRMNVAAQRASLGDIINNVSGFSSVSHIVTEAEVTTSTVVEITNPSGKNVGGFVVTVLKATTGAMVSTFTAVATTTKLTITDTPTNLPKDSIVNVLFFE